MLAAAGESENAHVILDAAGRLGLPPDAFAEAERAGAIAAAEDRMRFRHPLLRSLVYGRAGAEQRRGAHAALAASLEAANGTAGERRAWHLAAATVAPDEAVAGALAAAAGRFAQRTGYLAAAYAYERAAELTPAPAQRAERLVAAAEASRLAGRPAHARELLADAAPLAQDVSLHDEIALKDAMLEAWLGSVAVAAERYAAIADEVTERDPDRGAYALSLAAGTAIAAGDTGAALASARRAALLLPGVSESTACTVRETLGTVLVLRGEPGEGAPLLREAAAWFEREGELPGRDYVAQALLWVEDYELARRLLDPLLDHAGRVGDIRALTSALEVHAQLEFRTGHWREAHAAATRVRAARRRTPSSPSSSPTASPCSRSSRPRGAARMSRPTPREADEIAARNRLTVIAEYTGAARGLDALVARAARRGARRCSRTSTRAWSATGRRLPGVLQWEADLLEAMVRAEQLEAARAPARASWSAGRRRPRTPGAVRSRPGSPACSPTITGPASWRRCAATRRRRRRSRLRARGSASASGCAATAPASRRASSCAPPPTASGAIGAAPWVEAAERELGATGERLRRRALDAPEELTTQEREIAGLVAAGASNKDVAAELYLSPKTVEAHLTRVYRKLGVNSRTQLARRLEEERSATAN